MFGLTFDEIIYYVILGISLSYLWRAIKQIAKKDITFYKQEIYTDISVEKWAVIDGLLKGSTALVCLIYGLLCLSGHDEFWYVIVVAVINLALYLILYRTTLKRKEQTDSTVN